MTLSSLAKSITFTDIHMEPTEGVHLVDGPGSPNPNSGIFKQLTIQFN